MEERIGKTKYIFITLVLCIPLLFNFLNWNNWIIGLGFGLAYLIFYSFIFGSVFINKKGWQTIFGLLFLLSLVAVLGGGLIYLGWYNDYAFVILLFLIPALLMAFYYQIRPEEKFSLKKTVKKYLENFDQRREPKTNFLLEIAYLILASGCFYLLYLGQATKSIQAPWEVVSDKFFPLYFLATGCLLIYLFSCQRTKLPLLLLIIHSFLSTGVALIVYKIGYGFDPFIHQATEIIIAKTGQINPTPLYYLGQYAIVVFLNKLTTFDISLIDRVIVPVSFSIFIPTTIFYVFSYWMKKQYALVLALAALVIPYSKFIMTAPQNLANLFFALTIFLSLLYFRGEIKPAVIYLLVLATLAIHPLAGIPLLVTILLLNLFKLLYTSYSRYLSLYILAGLVFILFIPLAFIANGSQIETTPQFSLKDLKIFGWINQFDLNLDLAYLFNFNKIILAGLIITIGLIFIKKNKLLKNNAGYLMAAFVILADFFIVKYFLTFPNLRDYDQNDFTARLLLLVLYILLPFFLLGLYWLIVKFYEKDIFLKAFLIFILTGALTISFYLSYPRVNNYEPAKFFSVSASDIKAVNYIEHSADPEHIVLANQMVGAAAIKEFGFKKYYNNQFYYSMPMGNPRTFYEYYLDMIYEGAKKQTMEQAMAEANVSESYFVLNKYWRDSEKIAKLATESADKVIEIDNGEIWIFKYTK